MIDIEKAKKEFIEYVKQYDINNGRIRLKMTHILKVAEVSRLIASNLNLTEEQINLAELIGIFHDIGRFEQVRLYDTFSDKDSGLDHAAYSVKVLYEDGLIKRFLDTTKYDDIIKQAVYNHNKAKIDDSVQIDIRPEDLEIDTYRASGAGGQHINKTDSAVRIRHIPTGIVTSCQTQRSQIQNKEYALNMLKSKLYQYEMTKTQEKLKEIKGEVMENGWSSQIRSYVFCPYTLVKDHRTGFEMGNVQAVIDGEIDGFINAYLMQNKNK